ncbi:MAG TPA: hypothetical protein VJP45_02150 [Candidatus Limnocylindria bacterium]|nr:hypothetical protein [Candidatus Limnocylindria bacterium]
MTLFDPERGRPIVSAPCVGPGCWAGAPGAFRDGRDVYVVYRLRRPHPGRGYELRIAASHDSMHYETVWSATKEQFAAESIERCALLRDGGRWRLYASYVRRDDRRWRIGLLESASVDKFDPATIVPALTADAAQAVAVKDPWLRRVGDFWYMFVSYAPLPTAPDPALHHTGDALSTGRTLSHTGLASSLDGRSWMWVGDVLSPSGDGWDSYTARLSAAVREGDGWLGVYDGSATLEQNYEERCGLARSADLRHWERLSVAGPAIGTARGPGGVRYVEITPAQDVYYEYTRGDGAHELRATRL